MQKKTKWVIIGLAAVALIIFNVAPAVVAKRGGHGGPDGGHGGGHASDASGGRAAVASESRSQSETDEAASTDEASTDEAGSRKGRGPGGPHHHHPPMGELSEEDIVARAEARAESLFDHLDSNDDGLIDADEAAAAAAEKAQRAYDRLADRFGETETGIEVAPDSRLADRLGDIAADGVVTLEELNSAFADHLSEFDGDGDGTITAEELSSALVAEATERFDELDTNDDGVINADDRDSGDAD